MNKPKNYALPIAVMYALFFMVAFVTGLQNPMGVIVKSQFALSDLASQLGNFMNFAAYAFLGIPAGIILKRKGYKFTALTAIVVGIVGIGVEYASSYIYNPETDNQTATFITYLAGVFISGISMCLLNTVVNPMLNTLGGGGNKGNRLIQFGGTINSIGATIVPMLVAKLMGSIVSANIASARPALLLGMGIFVFAFLVILLVRIPEPHISPKGEQKNKDEKSPLAFRHLVLGTVAIFTYVGVEVGIPNFANLLMTTNGNGLLSKGLAMDPTIAGGIVGTYWFLMLIGRLIGASLGAKISSKAMLTFTSCLGILFIVLAIFSPLESTSMMPVFSNWTFTIEQVPVSIMFLTLCGLCTSVMWGGIFNLAVEGLGKYTPAASGFFMVMVCGGGILPLLQGQISDMTNYITSFWVIIAGLAYILYYALIGSKNVNTDIKVD